MPGLIQPSPLGVGLIDDQDAKYVLKRKGLSISQLGMSANEERTQNVLQDQLKD
jgi:hypothetical protein